MIRKRILVSLGVIRSGRLVFGPMEYSFAFVHVCSRNSSSPSSFGKFGGRSVIDVSRLIARCRFLSVKAILVELLAIFLYFLTIVDADRRGFSYYL